MNEVEHWERVIAGLDSLVNCVKELDERLAVLEAAQPKPLAWPKIDPDRLADSWIGGV